MSDIYAEKISHGLAAGPRFKIICKLLHGIYGTF
jgi:hypothetical protein